MLARKSTLFRDTGKSSKLTCGVPGLSDLQLASTTPPEPPASPTRDTAPRSAIESPIGRAFEVGGCMRSLARGTMASL